MTQQECNERRDSDGYILSGAGLAQFAAAVPTEPLEALRSDSFPHTHTHAHTRTHTHTHTHTHMHMHTHTPTRTRTRTSHTHTHTLLKWGRSLRG